MREAVEIEPWNATIKFRETFPLLIFLVVQKLFGIAGNSQRHIFRTIKGCCQVLDQFSKSSLNRYIGKIHLKRSGRHENFFGDPVVV